MADADGFATASCKSLRFGARDRGKRLSSIEFCHLSYLSLNLLKILNVPKNLSKEEF